MITRKEALKLIQSHGWTSNSQTALFNGEYVKNGSSFDEMEGIKEEYFLKDVLRWLGY